MTATNEARLVLVDDDISMCEFLSDSLSGRGFEVSWCTEP
jgi:DNA-binding response OmpR family regulator